MLLSIIKEAQKKVPAVKFALAVAALGAAGGIVTAIFGEGRIGIIVVGGVFVAMILLFVFSRLVTSQNPAINSASVVLLWAVIIFFCIFLTFTTTAFAFYWPQPWAEFLGVKQPGKSKDAILRDFEIPAKYLSDLRTLVSNNSVGLVRLQPPSPDPMLRAQRESVYRGGGAYYSFVQRTYDQGNAADVAYGDGVFRVGFAGADYGFFCTWASEKPLI